MTILRLGFFAVTLFSIVIGVGCGASDTSGPSAAEREAASKQKENDIRSLYERRAEFAAMKPPVTLQSPYIVKNAMILFKVPGTEYELVGWEEDSGGKMGVCGFDDCNDRDISSVKDRLPKEGRAESVVRADCKAGKVLGQLELLGFGMGPLYESDCEVTVIDLGSNTIVKTGRAVTKKPREDANGKIDDKFLVKGGDKKSQYVVPITAINDFLLDVK